MENPNCPAGALDHNFEFFTDNDNAHGYCLSSRRVLQYDEFPAELKDLLNKHFDQFPAKRAGARAMGSATRDEETERCLICNYGGFDNKADMINNVMQPTEFWACPHRGNCPFEGIVCDKLKTDSGEFLTPTEIQVIKHSAAGYLDKQIGNMMGSSLHTIRTHQRNIRRKTQLFRKPDITRFAHQKNLL
jgi:DNA-binding CsgD family transcriptional regulator